MPDCTAVTGSTPCMLEAPHEGRRHQIESPDGVLGTWVVTWWTPECGTTQPYYPDGPYVDTPAIAKREDFTG